MHGLARSTSRAHRNEGRLALRALSVALLPLACGGDQAPGLARSLEPVWVTPAEASSSEPAAARDRDGHLWLVHLEVPSVPPQTRGISTHVELIATCLDTTDPTWRVLAESIVAQGHGLAAPTLAPHPGGGVTLVYEDAPDGDQSLWRADLSLVDGDQHAIASKYPSRLTPVGAPKPVLPRLVASAEALVLVWQGLDGGQYDVFAERLDAGATGAVALTRTATDEWCPSPALTPDGTLHVAFERWDGEGTGGYDVALATLAVADLAGAVAPREVLVAGGPTHQALPEAAVDAGGGVWVAYEEAPQFGEAGSLRAQRTARLARVDALGAVAHADLPLELDEEQRGDLPLPVVGPQGLTLLRRSQYQGYSARNPKRDPFYSNWHTVVTTFDAAGGAVQHELEFSDGDQERQFSRVAGLPGAASTGLELVLAADRRSEEFDGNFSFTVPTETAMRVAVVGLPAPGGFPRLVPGPATPPTQRLGAGRDGVRGPALTTRSPHALLGDLHRHTHRSRCSGGQDGTFLDQVRYARGPGGLDFLAVTDHYQHLAPWSLWLTLRDSERWNAPGSLAVLPGVEGMVPGAGHQNLVWPSFDAAVGPVGSLMKQPGRAGEVVAIPHMSSSVSNPFLSEWIRPGMHRLLEVHQGKRGSYEGPLLPLRAADANARQGWVTQLVADWPAAAEPPGLISASDHGSAATSFAGVPWEFDGERRVPSRALLFEALVRGATFGCTGPRAMQGRTPHAVDLELRVDGGTPTLVVGADAEGLAYVELVRNGERIGRLDGEAGAAPGAARVYHVVQRHGTDDFQLEVEGGRFGAAWLRRPDSSQTDWEREDGRLRNSQTLEPFEGVFEILRDAAGEGDDGLTLVHRAAGRRRPVPLDGLAAGASVTRLLRDGREYPQLSVWNLGVPLAPALADPDGDGRARLEWTDSDPLPGALYYARVAWVDGNIAWTRVLRGPE